MVDRGEARDNVPELLVRRRAGPQVADDLAFPEGTDLGVVGAVPEVVVGVVGLGDLFIANVKRICGG